MCVCVRERERERETRITSLIPDPNWPKCVGFRWEGFRVISIGMVCWSGMNLTWPKPYLVLHTHTHTHTHRGMKNLATYIMSRKSSIHSLSNKPTHHRVCGHMPQQPSFSANLWTSWPSMGTSARDSFFLFGSTPWSSGLGGRWK